MFLLRVRGKRRTESRERWSRGRNQEPALGQLAQGLSNLRALSAQDCLLADCLPGPPHAGSGGREPFSAPVGFRVFLWAGRGRGLAVLELCTATWSPWAAVL